MKDADYSPPSSMTIPSSLMSSVPRRIIAMENTLSRLLQPECKQLCRGNESITSLPSQSLLERMGLGNQTLMIRLGLPLRACPSPAQTRLCLDLGLIPKEAYSNALPMRKAMSMETMHGIGKSLEEGHHGRMMRKD